MLTARVAEPVCGDRALAKPECNSLELLASGQLLARIACKDAGGPATYGLLIVPNISTH